MANCRVCELGLIATEEDEGICYGCKTNPKPMRSNTPVEPAPPPLHERVMLTTEMSVNLPIETRLEIITAEAVFGMNIFRDFFASVTDIVGGRSSATQKVLRGARTTVLDQLKREAHEIGANAVIAVDLDYSEISGQGKAMLFVIASGTAVILAEDDAAESAE